MVSSAHGQADARVDTPRVKLVPVMSRRETIMYAVLLTATVLLTVRYAWWWFQPGHLPHNPVGGPGWLQGVFDYTPFVALTVLEAQRVLQMLVVWVFGAVLRSAETMQVPGGQRVAVLTTIVPSSEPISILERTVPAMVAIRHPDPFDVWVLDEGDDPAVRALCERCGAHHFSRKGIERYNQPSGVFKARTKAGNHNAWRDQHAADYDIVAQMDPDHVPEPHFLEATLGYFSDPDVAYVIAPQVYYRNTASSWIARGADEANFGFSAVTQRGANVLGTPFFIGSNHVARSAALESVGGYASHIVEDHLTGMRLLTTANPATGRRWKGVYTDEIVSLGEGPTRWSSYLSQQLRWAYGLVSIVLSDSPRLFPRLRPRQMVGFALIESYYFSVASILALGLALTAAHLFFGINALDASFNDWLGHFLPQLSMSVALWYWLQRFYLRRTDQGWGVRSIVVMLGASVTYVQAVLLATFRRPLAYVITPKGAVGVREPARLFRWHIAVLLIALASLAFAVATGTGEWILRFWALLIALQMVVVLLTGVVAPGLLRTSLSSRLTDACNRYVVRVAVPLVITVAALFGAPHLPVFHEPPEYGREAALPSAHRQPPVQAAFLTPGSGRIGFGSFDPYGRFAVPGVVRGYFVYFGAASLTRLQTAVDQAAAQRQVAMLSWEPKVVGQPGRSATLLEQIRAGSWDGYLRSAARMLHATGQPVILRFAPEMDHTQSTFQPWAGRDPALFIAAWRHVHDIFTAAGANNVRWAWTPVGRFTFHGERRFASDRWYPGDAYVDMVGFTAYASWRWDRDNPTVSAGNTVRTPDQLVMDRYRALLGHGKPIVIPEWGVDLRASDRPPADTWIRDFVQLANTRMPRLAAVVYFYSPHNRPNSAIDWRLSPAEQHALDADLTSAPRFELAGS